MNCPRLWWIHLRARTYAFFTVADESVHCSDSALGDNNNQEILPPHSQYLYSMRFLLGGGHVEASVS